MILQPEHDIWTEVLEIISESNDCSSLKMCGLACRTWHSYVQPRLLLSLDIDWKHVPLSNDDINALLVLQHMLQRVRLRYWSAQGPYVSLPLVFANITTLELYGTNINLSYYEDISACFSSMSGNLRSLALIHCNVDNYRVMVPKNALFSFTAPSWALDYLHIQPNTTRGGLFLSLVSDWLEECALLEKLETVKITVDADTVDKLGWFHGSFHHLHVVLLEGSHDAEIHEGMLLTSSTLESFTISAADQSGVFLMFGIVNISELASLRTLYLMLPAPASHHRLPTREDGDEFWNTEEDFFWLHPQVTSVQVTVAVGDSPMDISFLWKYLETSELLQIVKSKGILVLVYDDVRYCVPA